MSKEENTVQPNLMTPYRGAYQAELDEPDEDTGNAANQNQNPDGSATSGDGPDLTPEQKAWKDRYDSLKAHHDKTINTLRKDLNDLKRQLEQSSKEKFLPTNPEDLAEFRKLYPDVFGSIKTIVRQEIDDEHKKLDSRFEELEIERKQTRREKAETALRRLHPDFDELRASKEFHDWVKEQPQQIQSWLYENEDDPLLAARAIDLYKADVKPAKSKNSKTDDARAASMGTTRTARVDADVTKDGKKIWKLSDIKRIKPHQFTDALEAEIDAAMREGRIVDDRLT
jgi:hypothetical protein